MFTYGKGQQNQPVSFLSSELDPFNIYTSIYFGVFFLLLPLLNIYGDILNGRYKSFAVSFVKRQRHVKWNPLKIALKVKPAYKYLCVCVCVLCFACDYAPKHSSRFHI